MNSTSSTSQTGDRVPAHLRKYQVQQQYDLYTPVDHAVWRFVMRQNRHFLEGRAHPAYLRGLQASGIGTEAIPRIEEMNACLAPHGWGAVTIGGFIPGVAFYDFQARGLLPIATAIRQLQHIEYTPAPDILHEAAGHAPILCDPDYANYVLAFGELGAKALASQEEHDLFDAVKHLSDLLEDGTASEEDLQAAKVVVAEKQLAASVPSEAELIARLYWWTVEYGLFGDLDHPLIYGAGLLSSVGESRTCLTDAVRKLPFDLATCMATPFDITTKQPQLFVCQSFAELTAAVQTFADQMAFRHGGLAGLQKAQRSGHTATVQFSSGLQVSGTLTDVQTDETGLPAYVRFRGATALAFAGHELPGQGTQRHKDGYSTPVGLVSGTSLPLETCSETDLTHLGIREGAAGKLHFVSGVTVEGTVLRCVWKEEKLVLITWGACTVQYRGNDLFVPNYGEYDMAVGAEITSVWADAADPELFYAEQHTTPSYTPDKIASANEEVHVVLQSPADDTERTLRHTLYQTVRTTRVSLQEQQIAQQDALRTLQSVIEVLQAKFPLEWLLRVEIYELLCRDVVQPSVRTDLLEQILHLRDTQYPHLRELIDNALQLAHQNGLVGKSTL